MTRQEFITLLLHNYDKDFVKSLLFKIETYIQKGADPDYSKLASIIRKK